MCGKEIRASQQSTKNGEKSYFSLSNIERHWKIHAIDKKQRNVKERAKKPNQNNNKPQKRKLRSAAEIKVEKNDSADDVQFEVLSEKDTYWQDEFAGDFKIVLENTEMKK